MALNVSEAVKNKYLSDEFNGDYKIVIGGVTYTGRNVRQGSVEIVESLCSGDNFDLSAVEKGEISFTLINFTEDIKNIQGKTLSMVQTVAGVDVPIGTDYVVQEASFTDEYLVDVKAYDGLTAFDRDITNWWNNTVTFPITHRNLLIALCTYCGVSHNIPSSYCNSALQIIKAIDNAGMTGLDLLGWLQEVAGCFYRINRYGTLVSKRIDIVDGLLPRLSLYPANSLNPSPSKSYSGNAIEQEYTVPQIVSDLEMADYLTEKIDKLQVKGTVNDIGAIVGTGTNCYVIESNPLLFALTAANLEQAATNIFNVLKNVSYRPFQAMLKGLPYLETGDLIQLTSLKGVVSVAPIMKRTMTGSGLAYDMLECRGEQKRAQKTATNKKLNVLNQKTHELINTVEEMSSTITEITTEVSALDDDVSGLQTTVTQHTTQIAQNSEAIVLRATKTEAQGYADTAQQNAVSTAAADATSKANAAESNANNYTDGKLADYSTTVEMRSEISQAADNITLTVSQTYETKTDASSKISGVDVEYAENQSTTTAPVSGWSTTAPAWREGYYIWQRTATTNGSGTTYSNPTCISGRDGAPGAPGADGTSVTVSSIQYAATNSGDTSPSNWQSSIPTLSQGQWLWVRTTYSDGSAATTKSYIGTDGDDGNSVYVQSATKTGGTTTVVIADSEGHTNTLTINDGEDGNDGTPGTNGLNGYVHVAWANSADGSTDFSTTVSTGKRYLGTYTDNTAADSTDYHSYSWSLIKGADGTSVTISSIEYGVTNSGSTAPSSWSTTIPTVSKGQWLWCKTTYSNSSEAITKSYVGTDGDDGSSVSIVSATKSGDTTTVVIADGTTTSTLTIVDGEDGSNGQPGTNGLNGYVHTAWANSADGTVDFSTTVSANKKYLGTYTDNTAADSTSPSAYSWSLIKGEDGQNGEDGLGISSVTIRYGKSSSESTTPESWSSSIPSLAPGEWLWCRNYTTYTDGTHKTSYTKAYNGTNGTNGTDGTNGQDGRGVSSIVEQYYLSTSNQSCTGGSWSDSQPTWVSGKYIWTRSHITWSDNTTSDTTPVLATTLNDLNATVVQHSTEIAQNASDIALRVLETDYTGSNIISKINLDSSGVQIAGSKVNIDTSSLSLKFGSQNSQIEIKATTGNDGVLFTGSGKIDFKTTNEFYARNLDSSDHTANDFKLVNSSTASQAYLQNFQNNQLANYVFLYKSSSYHYTILANKNSNDKFANILRLDNSNYPYVRITNYQKDNNASDYIASNLYIKQTSDINSFDFYNNRKSSNTNLETATANHQAMYSWETNSTNVFRIDNYHWNGNIGNYLDMRSASNGSSFTIQNNNSSGNGRSWLSMAGDGTVTLAGNTGGTSHLKINSNGNMDVKANNDLVLYGSRICVDGSYYGAGQGGAVTGTDNIAVKNWDGSTITVKFYKGLYIGYSFS